jgi:hypothetical protein
MLFGSQMLLLPEAVDDYVDAPKKLVFIDETWASTNMTPHFGRCEPN